MTESSTKVAAIVAGVTITAIIVIAVALIISWQIHATGRIKTLGIEVYADQELTKQVSAIDWGTLTPGAKAQIKIWMKITGNAPANVTMSTDNWDPPNAQAQMSFTWDFDGHTVQPNEVVPITFELEVYHSIVGINNFSFDIFVTARSD